MGGFRKLFGDITQGAGDVLRAGADDIRNHYAQSVWGQTAPITAPTADMEYTTTPQEAEPQSYGAALRTHSNMEQAGIRAKFEAGQGASHTEGFRPTIDAAPSNSPAPPQETPSHEPEV